MDKKELVAGICIDHSMRWLAKARDALNGSGNLDRILREAQADTGKTGDGEQAEKVEDPGEIDFETASRDELVAKCLSLGYTQLEVKAKRVKTLREMIEERLKEDPEPAPTRKVLRKPGKRLNKGSGKKLKLRLP